MSNIGYRFAQKASCYMCGQVDYLALGMVVGTSIGLVVLASLCCASCVWCMKHDSAYGGSSRLVSAYSIR